MISDWIDDDVLTICVDMSGLPGYLAVDPTRAMADELGVEIQWLPLTSGLDRYSARTPNEDPDDPLAAYKARRRRARDRYARLELERNCQRLNLSIEQGSRLFDPAAAAIALLWARKCEQDPAIFVREVFEAGFRRGEPVEEPGAIKKLLAICNVPLDGFDEYRETVAGTELDSLQTLLIDTGAFISPAYLYKGERFLGREHLPLICWYLSGQKDPPPV